MKQGLCRAAMMLSLAFVVSGCAVGWMEPPGVRQDVKVAVRNPSAAGVEVRVCAPAGCLPSRAAAAGRQAEFRFPSEGGTRAVVTAKRGDRVVDQQPVDFRRGGRYQVVLDVP